MQVVGKGRTTIVVWFKTPPLKGRGKSPYSKLTLGGQEIFEISRSDRLG